jgi:hypothetical protein
VGVKYRPLFLLFITTIKEETSGEKSLMNILLTHRSSNSDGIVHEYFYFDGKLIHHGKKRSFLLPRPVVMGDK